MALSQSAARLVGMVLAGRYRLERLTTDDGSVAVFVAQHTHMHKRVCVKMLSAAAARAPEALARFEREAIAGAHVEHANVTLAKDFGTLDDGSRFLVMELLEGPTLRERLGKGHVPTGQALRIARQLALALEAVHRAGIVHRALCPEHVALVERGGETDVVKLLEFGSAKLPSNLVERSSPAPGAAERVATPIGSLGAMMAYIAPEIAGGVDPDARSDLFALGVILVELVAGCRPEQAREVVRTLPPGVREIAAALLATNPDARPESGAAVADRLAALGGGAALVAPMSARASRALITAPAPTIVEMAPNGGPGGGPRARAGAARGASREPASDASAARWNGIPEPIRALLAGGAAILLVVVGAIAVRAPIEDVAEATAAASASAPRDATTSPPVAPASAASSSALGISVGAPAPPPATSATSAAAPLGAALPRGSTRELRNKLQKDLETGKHAAAVADIDALIQTDPTAVEDRDLRNLIVDLAMRIMVGQGPECDQLFDVMSSRMGTRGIDLLYELVTTRGGSRAAKRAEEMLRLPEIYGRGSPAVKIAWDMRSAKCDGKAALFERAKADGDGRTLGQLYLMNQSCRGRGGQCCMHNDPKLKDAIAVIRARVE
jgi:eukaryotic-like serine/threonine-protein kinase